MNPTENAQPRAAEGEVMVNEFIDHEIRGKHLRFWDGVLLILALLALQIAAMVFTSRFFRPLRISFMSDRDGNYEVYLMNSDGSGLKNLTNNEAEDGLPGWSAKRGEIAFLSTRGSTSGSILRMNIRGSNLVELVKDMPIIATPPEWSRDGKWIAFESGSSGQSDVYLISVESGELRNLTDHPSANRFADWSSDSERILFTSNRGGNPAIFIVNIKSGEEVQLTGDEYASALAMWSPDGTKIAFTSDLSGDVEVYVMDNDGGNITCLTETEGFDGFPVWSPDGSTIAFLTYRDDDAEIYAMDADGSNERNLTNNPAQDSNGADFFWSPDGSQILFNTDRDGDFEIYIMDADGSHPTNLSNNLAEDVTPTWID
jgi:Tol biopolymer transport system component